MANAQGCLRAGPQTLNIIGHGDQGVILTGSADLRTTDQEKFIGVSNQAAWQNDFRSIDKSLTLLRLCACDTGAGRDGADLLNALAARLGVEVEAPTGLVYLESGTADPFLEPCAIWHRATPGVPVQPIDPPKIHSAAIMPMLELRGIEPTGLTDVLAVEFYETTTSQPLRSWTGPAATVAVTFGDFANPFEPGAVPAAIDTGTLVVRFKDTTGVPSRRFRVYNQRLLQDLSRPETYYYADVGALLRASF